MFRSLQIISSSLFYGLDMFRWFTCQKTMIFRWLLHMCHTGTNSMAIHLPDPSWLGWNGGLRGRLLEPRTDQSSMEKVLENRTNLRNMSKRKSHLSVTSVPDSGLVSKIKLTKLSKIIRTLKHASAVSFQLSWFESTSPVLSCCSCCAQKSRPINWDGNYTHGEDSGHIRTSNPIKSLKLTNIYQYLTNTYQYLNILPILTNILPICINMSSIFKSKYVLKYSTKTSISEFPRSHLASGSSRIQYSDLRILGVWENSLWFPHG